MACRRLGLRFGRTFYNAITATSISTCAAAAIMTNIDDKTQRIKHNRILGDKHRVVLGEWPIVDADMDKDTRINTLNRLAKYLQDTGYDGIEMSLENFMSVYFKNLKLSKEETVNIIRGIFDAANLTVPGILLKSFDNDWKPDNVEQYLSDLKESLYYNKKLGAEYATFQIFLPDEYMSGDGSYRNNQRLLEQYVERINILQEICFQHGFNFYVETHVGRISEDPQAFVRVMDLNDKEFEINGDLSHYLCRGMLKGPYIDRILGKMEHTHVRMARVYGDISVNVEDAVKDWEDPNGVTRIYWNLTKKGFENGLSSRVIVGESGPIHLVDDALKQDEKMLPMYREMAKYCDLQTEKDDFSKESFNPFANF